MKKKANNKKTEPLTDLQKAQKLITKLRAEKNKWMNSWHDVVLEKNDYAESANLWKQAYDRLFKKEIERLEKQIEDMDKVNQPDRKAAVKPIKTVDVNKIFLKGEEYEVLIFGNPKAGISYRHPSLPRQFKKIFDFQKN